MKSPRFLVALLLGLVLIIPAAIALNPLDAEGGEPGDAGDTPEGAVPIDAPQADDVIVPDEDCTDPYHCHQHDEHGHDPTPAPDPCHDPHHCHGSDHHGHEPMAELRAEASADPPSGAADVLLEQSRTIHVTIANIGALNATVPFNVTVWIRPLSFPQIMDAATYIITLAPLAAGDEHSFEVAWDVQDQAGRYIIDVIPDSGDVIPEYQDDDRAEIVTYVRADV